MDGNFVFFPHFKVFWHRVRKPYFEDVNTKAYKSFSSNMLVILSVLEKNLSWWTLLPIKCLQPYILLNYSSELTFTVHYEAWAASIFNKPGIWDLISTGFHCIVCFLVLSESQNFPHKIVKDEIQKKTQYIFSKVIEENFQLNLAFTSSWIPFW